MLKYLRIFPVQKRPFFVQNLAIFQMKSLKVLRNLKLNIISFNISLLYMSPDMLYPWCSRTVCGDRGKYYEGNNKLDQDKSKPSCWTSLIYSSASMKSLQIVVSTSEALGFGSQVKGNQKLIARKFSPKNMYQLIPQIHTRFFHARCCP